MSMTRSDYHHDAEQPTKGGENNAQIFILWPR